MIYLGYSGGSCIIFKTLSILEICQIHNHNWRLKMPPCKVKTEQQNNCFFSNLPLTGLSDFSCGNQNPWRISASTDIYITWRWNKRNNFLNWTDELPSRMRQTWYSTWKPTSPGQFCYGAWGRPPCWGPWTGSWARACRGYCRTLSGNTAGDTAGYCQVTLQGILQDIVR